jgi:hypothetical protein
MTDWKEESVLQNRTKLIKIYVCGGLWEQLPESSSILRISLHKILQRTIYNKNKKGSFFVAYFLFSVCLIVVTGFISKSFKFSFFLSLSCIISLFIISFLFLIKSIYILKQWLWCASYNTFDCCFSALVSLCSVLRLHYTLS